jgi:hypothetical protein
VTSGEKKQEDAVKYKLVMWCILLAVPLVCGQGFKPAGGFVPNADTAVKIAEAVLVPVYGKDRIESERPFTAKLKRMSGRFKVRCTAQMVLSIAPVA